MQPEFSLKYGGKEYTLPAKSGEIYELEQGVTVKAEEKEYKEYGALEWVLYFENKGKEDSKIFSDICDCDTLLPLSLPVAPKAGYRTETGNVCVITMNGMVDGNYYWENDKLSATEYNLNFEYLDKTTTKKFANIGGRSSEGMMPFFDVTANGFGYISAIGWSGNWKAEFSKTENGVTMKSGLKKTEFYLMPGEKIRTTSTLIMPYSSSEDKYNKFRSLIKQHFSHKAIKENNRDGLMACELWGGLTSEEMKKRIKEFAKYDINFEDVWIDAGWYGQCENCDEAFTGDWGEHTGEWEVNTRVHPQGLKDVSDCAKEAGMHLMLWFEPERAIAKTNIVRTHPEWFLKLPNDINTILNYGNRDALEHIFNLISGYIEDLDLSCYRQDFNVQLTSYFRENDEANRIGITEIKHITGMYELWDRLLKKYPDLLIDNCSSGGRRIDIETLKRSIPFFRSDYQCNFNENPEVLQTHNTNISCYLPYNGCTTKTKNDTYAIRSSYSSSWGGAFYNAIFQSMTDEDFRWVKTATDEYRKIRKYFSKDFYNHGSNIFDNTAWAIWQYHDPDTQSGIVMAFRRDNSPFDSVKIELKATDNNKEYLFENFDTKSSVYGNNKLNIILPKKHSSVIFKYQVKI